MGCQSRTHPYVPATRRAENRIPFERGRSGSDQVEGVLPQRDLELAGDDMEICLELSQEIVVASGGDSGIGMGGEVCEEELSTSRSITSLSASKTGLDYRTSKVVLFDSKIH